MEIGWSAQGGRLANMQKRLTSIYNNGRPYMMAVVLTALRRLPSPAHATEVGANPNGIRR